MSTAARRLHQKFSDKRMQDLFEEAVALGWTWRKGGSGHVLMRAPTGDGFVSMSTTPVDPRAVLNNRAYLRKWKKEQGIG